MDPVTVATIASGGGQFLSSLADQIFGGMDKDRLERFIRRLRERRNQPVMGNIEGEVESLFQADAPMRNRYAEAVNQRLGLDSGVAEGELARLMSSQRAGIRADLMKERRDRTFRRDQVLDQLEARLVSQIAAG